MAFQRTGKEVAVFFMDEIEGLLAQFGQNLGQVQVGTEMVFGQEHEERAAGPGGPGLYGR